MEYPYAADLVIPAGWVNLPGFLTIPSGATAIIVFAHGSGSSRLSVRNQAVAQYLQDRGLGTLLFDLLTPEEDRVYENRFDMPLLAERLVKATRWLGGLPVANNKRIGYFGASTGAAAALLAAAQLPMVAAVVSRGGRPDLAGTALGKVKVPVLLITGGLDDVVIELNKQALDLLPGIKKLEIVPGASHLFEEEGKLAIVSALAGEWFSKYLLRPEIIE